MTSQAKQAAHSSRWPEALAIACDGRRNLRAEATRFLRGLNNACFDSYRPERHYMRGPGPRYCAMQGLGAN